MIGGRILSFPVLELLCMDLQGAEMEALEGMGDVLDSVKYIITEGQCKRLYHDTPLIGDIEQFDQQRILHAVLKDGQWLLWRLLLCKGLI